jgi:4-amino-4-deoxy-L-arabinose transferase-like glycosyltransferase
VAVAIIHIKDQGGFPGHKDPSYIGIGYFVLEFAAIAAAALLLSKAFRKGWFLSLGVAVGPLVGFILTRGPGLPMAVDDRGNWTETLGLISLVVEGVLLLLILAVAARRRGTVTLRNA